ncbi:hypothetical protein B0O99DRAFT_479639, partial [Bisporella sp. PMI_857]
NIWLQVFIILFLFKYIKVVVHTLSFLLYSPYKIPKDPTIRPEDVTVIVPTVSYFLQFRETLKTILANSPYQIIISTVGPEKGAIAERVCDDEYSRSRNKTTRMTVVSITEASKRKQILRAVQEVRTQITALADDHVFWGPMYLRSALAPFEDPKIGGVGTNKRVRRDPFEFSWANFLNFIACNYLERHNFECTASVNIDQGVFVLSGRTALYRTDIFQHPRFPNAWLKETWFFGLVGKDGGIGPDDDNCLTRFTIGVAKYNVWFQNSIESTMHTTLGQPGKFFQQMDRWLRTTWRSNSTSLFSDMTPWKVQPWSVYAVYLSSFVNIGLFYDLALLGSLWMAPTIWEIAQDETSKETAILILAVTLLLSKLIKPFPHFWRNPRDIIWIPGYILFGYYAGFIKLKALVTAYNVSWGTR